MHLLSRLLEINYLMWRLRGHILKALTVLYNIRKHTVHVIVNHLLEANLCLNFSTPVSDKPVVI